MKVIKVGTSAQSRIAQACDRCRSKKIRCDGTRPTCSQCANVGFECRTSDKLSRRAFPRGYTESLEERVRALETEVRELKDLLDEKDEKIDLLSRMHGNRQSSYAERTQSNAPGSSPRSPMDTRSSPPLKEDTFRVQASPLLLGVEDSDSFFMGPSSGRSFVGKLWCASAYTHFILTICDQRLLNAKSRRQANLAATSTQRPSCTFKAASLSSQEKPPDQ